MFNKQLIKDILSLSKVMISVAVTYTAFAGFVIANGQIDLRIIPLAIGVFILSSGASAFNHIIERNTDALMGRTQNRPLPSGRISVKFAVIYAVSLALAGFLILAFEISLFVGLLGLFNLFWYILVYTPLKKKTVWALFVGTLTGVIPFFMGYFTIATGLPDPRANFVAIFLMIWQIPHFLLLMGIYGKEYEKAGLASITQRTNEPNLYRMSILWLLACCAILFLFPLYRISNYLSTNYIIIVISGIIFILGLYSLISEMKRKYLVMFILTNLMQLTIVTSLIFDHLG